MHVVGSIPQTVSTMRSSLGLVATDAVRLNAYSLAKRRPQAENTHPVTAERGGAKGACAPGGTVHGAAFGGAKMQNSEIRPLLANQRFVCTAERIRRFR